ncbi:hypothetical protein IscW_ISCW014778, partial [Ixodes scapularis]
PSTAGRASHVQFAAGSLAGGRQGRRDPGLSSRRRPPPVRRSEHGHAQPLPSCLTRWPNSLPGALGTHASDRSPRGTQGPAEGGQAVGHRRATLAGPGQDRRTGRRRPDQGDALPGLPSRPMGLTLFVRNAGFSTTGVRGRLATASGGPDSAVSAGRGQRGAPGVLARPVRRPWTNDAGSELVRATGGLFPAQPVPAFGRGLARAIGGRTGGSAARRQAPEHTAGQVFPGAGGARPDLEAAPRLAAGPRGRSAGPAAATTGRVGCRG